MAYDEDESFRRNRNSSWWKQRTNMERRCVILFVIAILLIIGLIIGVIVASHKATKAQNETKDALKSMCLTPSCVQSAASIMENMDNSVKPCDDFYKFTCGGFEKKTEIPPSRSAVSNFHIVADEINKQQREVLEEPFQANEIKPFVLAKKFYNACMDIAAIKAQGLTTVKKLLREVGGWPTLEGRNWNENTYDWKNSQYLFRKLGFDVRSFLFFMIETDAKNTFERRLALYSAITDVSQPYLLAGPQNEIVKAYQSYMVDLAVYFGAEKLIAEYDVRDMINFQIELAKISPSPLEARNNTFTNNPMTIAQLQQRYQSIPWTEFINHLLAIPGKSVTHTDIVNIQSPRFLTGLENLLRSTPKRVQANHAIFQTLKSLVKYLPEDIIDRSVLYEGATSGITVRGSKTSECVDTVNEVFGIAAGAMFVRKYFNNKDLKQKAEKMTLDIQKEFIKVLEHINWMDKDTKNIAIEKAKAMRASIAYPDEFLNDQKLEEYYAKLESADTYFEFMMRVNKFVTDTVFADYGTRVNKTDWKSRTPVATTNANYIPYENSISLAAAILQAPFFNQDLPNYMNYGGMGYIIGHEVSHGFDMQGRELDKDGNLNNWWANDTNKVFTERAQCMIKQYGEITVTQLGPEAKLNGVLTASENIADNGGVKTAYRAYNALVEREGAEPALPGLNYTANQMFWIAVGNTWCAKFRKQDLADDLLTDPHSPMPYRVTVPLRNSEDFAKDFNCPAESPMNPKHKCAVW